MNSELLGVVVNMTLGRNGMVLLFTVGTIPEETEEQMLEKSLRGENIHSLNGVVSKRKTEAEPGVAPAESKMAGGSLDSPHAKLVREKEPHHENKMDVQSCDTVERNSEPITQTKPPNNASKSAGQGTEVEASRQKSRSPEHKKHRNDQKRTNKQHRGSEAERTLPGKKDKKSKVAKESVLTPRLVDGVAGSKGIDSPRLQHKDAKGQLSLPKLPKLALDLVEQDPPRKHKGQGQDLVRTPRIAEPGRTPRTQDPLVAHVERQERGSQERHKVPKQNLQQVPKQQQQQQQQQQQREQQQQQHLQQQLKPVLKNKKKKSSSESRRKVKIESTNQSVHHSARSVASKGSPANQRPDTRDSELSVPFEPGLMDYYSDDFDESSGPETEEGWCCCGWAVLISVNSTPAIGKYLCFALPSAFVYNPFVAFPS